MLLFFGPCTAVYVSKDKHIFLFIQCYFNINFKRPINKCCLNYSLCSAISFHSANKSHMKVQTYNTYKLFVNRVFWISIGFVKLKFLQKYLNVLSVVCLKQIHKAQSNISVATFTLLTKLIKKTDQNNY